MEVYEIAFLEVGDLLTPFGDSGKNPLRRRGF